MGKHFFYFLYMNIFVGNLNYKVEEYDLQSIFADYGEVKSAKLIKDRMTGRSKGFGFVEMDDEAEAKKAIQELNGAVLENREMVVNEAKPRENNGGGNFRRDNNRSYNNRY